MHRHPVNQAHHDDRSAGERASDWVAATMGSWRFIAIQTVLIIAWVGLNITAVVGRWDPYPFILLNLAFSVQAAYASPFILLSQNRQSAHDRQVAEHDYAVNQKTLALLRAIGRELIHLEQQDEGPGP
jgi:uncharacterized membrane protein